MSGSFEVRGADQLEALGRRFKAAGEEGKGLRKELLAGIRSTNKPTIAMIRTSALDVLPKRGGLAAIVARSSIGTRTRLAGNAVGVEIKGTGKVNIRRMNAGSLRKPVFGNRENWVAQSITPGWFNKPIEADRPRIQAGIEKSLQTVARKIEKG